MGHRFRACAAAWLIVGLFHQAAWSAPVASATDPSCVPEGIPPPLHLPWQNAAEVCAAGWGVEPKFGLPWADGKPTPAGKAWNQSDDDAFAAKVQAFLRNFSYRETTANGKPGLNWMHDPRWRLTGAWQGCPGSGGTSTEVHPAVRIYYSPEVMQWLCTYRLSNPQGTAPEPADLPAGAMIVKEMQAINGAGQIAYQTEGADRLLWVKASDHFDEISANKMMWTIMSKGSGVSQDDWFWGYFDGSGEYNPPIAGASAFAAELGADGKPVEQPPPDPHFYPTFWDFSGGVVYPNYGFGNYCIYCHGSAEDESTFSSLSNLIGKEVRYPYLRAGSLESLHDDHTRGAGKENNAVGETRQTLTRRIAEPGCDGTRPAGFRGSFAVPCDENVPRFEQTYPQFAGMSYDAAWALRLPAQTWDHHLATGGESPDQFMTSDQCMPCHDVGGSGQRQPNMTVKAMGRDGKPAESLVNLAEFGEWSASPMGLGGRDPIFYAMLESEVNRAAKEPKLKDFAECIQNTCLHCHGNQGQRQFALDHPETQNGKCDQLASLTDPTKTGHWSAEDAKKAGYHGHPFLLKTMAAWRDSDSALAKYGGLGRDGIACMTCHHVSSAGLGQSGETFTGNFRVGPANEAYGPFDKNIVTEPMQQSLGVNPMLGEQISSSGLCGSCHAIYLPAFDNEGNYLQSSFEQTTYLEWLNSAFNENNDSVSPSEWQSCQQCHMGDAYRNPDGHMTSLASQKIANVEDNTFPEAENLLPALEQGLDRRDYKRHTLYGLNVFMAEYFRQFPFLLGVRQQDEMAGSPATAGAAGIIPPLITAREEVLKIARHDTAQIGVEIVDSGADGGTLTADVTVTNLAGHKLPSGIGFRRAFIEFQVLDADGNAIWASGRSNEVGLLLNGTSDSETLKTDLLEPGGLPGCTENYQPHYQTITEPCQVQIYEELSQDSAGHFTTSFVHRVKELKDNRLLPKGYKVLAVGEPQPAYCAPWCSSADPVGLASKDPDYQGGKDKGVAGSDRVRYQVKLSADQRKAAATVSATLYSQATAPYFLNQRFSQAKAAGAGNDDNARRLYYLTSHLNTDAKADDGKPYISRYRLRIVSASAALN